MKTSFSFATISIASSIVGWQEQLEWGTRMIAGVLGILAATISILVSLRAYRKSRTPKILPD